MIDRAVWTKARKRLGVAERLHALCEALHVGRSLHAQPPEHRADRPAP